MIEFSQNFLKRIKSSIGINFLTKIIHLALIINIIPLFSMAVVPASPPTLESQQAYLTASIQIIQRYARISNRISSLDVEFMSKIFLNHTTAVLKDPIRFVHRWEYIGDRFKSGTCYDDGLFLDSSCLNSKIKDTLMDISLLKKEDFIFKIN